MSGRHGMPRLDEGAPLSCYRIDFLVEATRSRHEVRTSTGAPERRRSGRHGVSHDLYRRAWACLTRYASSQEAKTDLFDYIRFGNHPRRHSVGLSLSDGVCGTIRAVVLNLPVHQIRNRPRSPIQLPFTLGFTRLKTHEYRCHDEFDEFQPRAGGEVRPPRPALYLLSHRAAIP